MNKPLSVAALLGVTFSMIGAGTAFADTKAEAPDVMGSCVTLYGLRLAAEPADQTHPSGHGRAETIASAVTALVLVVVGGTIFWQALRSLSEPRHAPADCRRAVRERGAAAQVQADRHAAADRRRAAAQPRNGLRKWRRRSA